MHTHVDTRVRLPEECPSCKTLWDILARSVTGVRYELEYARGLREEYGEKEMLTYLTKKADDFQIMKWHTERYS